MTVDQLAKPHRLKKRKQFLAAAAKGKKQVAPAFIIQSRPRDPDNVHDAKQLSGLGLGFTASKKVGNSVARSKAKRRMRALSREMFPQSIVSDDRDMVLIARGAMLKRPYRKLKRDMIKAIKGLESAS